MQTLALQWQVNLFPCFDHDLFSMLILKKIGLEENFCQAINCLIFRTGHHCKYPHKGEST